MPTAGRGSPREVPHPQSEGERHQQASRQTFSRISHPNKLLFLVGMKAAALLALSDRGPSVLQSTNPTTYHLGDAGGDVGFGGTQGALLSLTGCWFVFSLEDTVVRCNRLLLWDWVGLLLSALWSPCKRSIRTIKPDGNQRSSL